jgi:two-component system response regulator VanR
MFEYMTAQQAQKILIIEDEAAIQKILSEPLTHAGYKITTASDGLEGINIFHEQDFDLILLDIMLPKIDGYTVCEMIRQESQIPIILLTALDTEDAQIKGFDKLADDYITKPFSIKLVLKRVEALLRRTSSDTVSDSIRYKEITLSETERKVTLSGNEIALTHLEFEILLLLLKNKGRVFTRDDLFNLVWGYDFVGDEKGVNFHIMNLRRKLGVDYIETVRGVGYRIAKDN